MLALYPRVLSAYRRHYACLRARLLQLGISPDTLQIFLRVYKYEQQLELWVHSKSDPIWRYFDRWEFCISSGTLGPKRREGDGQIPEGIYHIDRFNPRSRYHLSLGINYPNEADRQRADPSAPGSDIFIHGGCSSTGCVAITDEGIEPVYVLARMAKRGGQELLPVHIFPFRYTEDQWDTFAGQYPEHVSLWRELRVIAEDFDRYRRLRPVGITPGGAYRLLPLG